jgi:hypothetical protein
VPYYNQHELAYHWNRISTRCVLPLLKIREKLKNGHKNHDDSKEHQREVELQFAQRLSEQVGIDLNLVHEELIVPYSRRFTPNGQIREPQLQHLSTVPYIQKDTVQNISNDLTALTRKPDIPGNRPY